MKQVMIFLLVVLAVVATFVVATKKAKASPGESQVRVLENVGIDSIRMRIVCDSLRGNVVYITTGDGGINGGSTIGVSVVHQPELCK